MKIESKVWSVQDLCGDKVLYDTLNTGSILILLADGMSGLEHADKAATIAINEVHRYMCLHSADDPCIAIPQAIVEADKAIREASYELHCKMGTALLILLVQDRVAYFTGIGDVRLYHALSDGSVVLLTHDHQMIVKDCSYLTQSIRGRGGVNPQVNICSLSSADRLLLCTDGAYRRYPIGMFLDGAWKSHPMNIQDDDFSFILVSFVD